MPVSGDRPACAFSAARPPRRFPAANDRWARLCAGYAGSTSGAPMMPARCRPVLFTAGRWLSDDSDPWW